MKITLHDKRIFMNPDGTTLSRLLSELKEADNFIVLSDEKIGEIRAAGPLDGKFLVQCDLHSISGVFKGERDEVDFTSLHSIFLAFLKGDTAWKETMSNRNPKLSEVLHNPGFYVVIAPFVVITYFIIKWVANKLFK
ncbi:MAG: hypothetical protein ABIC04_06950 [Nanoarchaeota archaeon]